MKIVIIQNKSMYKGIRAVSFGFLTVVLLSVGTDFLLEKIGVLPPQTSPELYMTWMLALALFYRCIYTLVGGYVTARYAGDNAMHYVKILGILGIIGGTLGVVFGWNLSDHWYPIAILITAFPLTWWGGKMVKRV